MKQKIGATTSCWTGFSLENALEGISKAGLEYMELSAMFEVCDSKGEIAEHVVPEDMGAGETKALKDTIQGFALSPMSISGHVDLVQTDGVDALKRRIDLARRIGASVVNTKTGDPSSQAEVQDFFKHVEEAAEYAAQNEILIGLETSGSYFNTAKKAVPILKRINSEYVKLNYDTANVLYYEDVRPQDDIEHGIEYLVHVHLKDKRGGKGEYDFPALGEGIVDFEKIFSILSRNRYTGPLSIEIEFDGKHNETLEGVHKAVSESCSFLKRFVDFS
jgi:sugar phosphate isomerase/epimerase